MFTFIDVVILSAIICVVGVGFAYIAKATDGFEVKELNFDFEEAASRLSAR